MRLVIDVRLLHNSGIGTYIKNIVPSILIHFNEVYLLGDPEIIKNIDWGCSITIIPFRSKIYSFTEQILYPLRIPDCDVFWSPHFNTPILPIKAKRRMATIHDVNHLSNPQYFSFAKRVWANVLYKNAVKRSDVICTVSKFSKSEILKFFSVTPNKIKIVYGGVNRDFSKNIVDNQELKLPSKYILFVGNVKPHKNLITLLKAYNNLDRHIKNQYKLVVLGKKEGFITRDTEVFRYIEKEDLRKHIHFTNYVPDDTVPQVYKNASLFVFPSLYEGFGLPLLEAMCCEVPVLSSDKASLPEVGGEAVVYFDPNNLVELKEKITMILKNNSLQSELKCKGLQRIKKFDWKIAIKNHMKILKLLNE